MADAYGHTKIEVIPQRTKNLSRCKMAAWPTANVTRRFDLFAPARGGLITELFSLCTFRDNAGNASIESGV